MQGYPNSMRQQAIYNLMTLQKINRGISTPGLISGESVFTDLHYKNQELPIGATVSMDMFDSTSAKPILVVNNLGNKVNNTPQIQITQPNDEHDDDEPIEPMIPEPPTQTPPTLPSITPVMLPPLTPPISLETSSPPPSPISLAASSPPPTPPRWINDEETVDLEVHQKMQQGVIKPHVDYNLTAVPEPKIQNIVATVNLECKLNLSDIASKARNCEYNPRRFAAVVMRIREPRTTALIFKSGKLVVTGAKSVRLSQLASRKYARIIQQLGYEPKVRAFKIQNMVASVTVKFKIHLSALAIGNHPFAVYEPEIFPGLIYRMVKPRILILLFSTGKVILTGAREEGQFKTAFNLIYPVLQKYQKTDDL